MSFIHEQAPEGPAWRAARQRRLLQATIDALRTQSADNISMDEIARAAGVGKATLYRYFHTKEGLLRACLADIVEDIGRQMEAAEASGEAPHERLRDIIRIMVEAFSRDLLPMRLLTRHRGELDEEWHRAVQDARRRLVTVLDGHFRHGMQAGSYRELDLVLMPHLIMGMIRSGVTHTVGLSNAEIADGIHDTILRGLGAGFANGEARVAG